MLTNRSPQSPDQRTSLRSDACQFAFRIESDRVILAMGESNNDEPVAMRFDMIRLDDSELSLIDPKEDPAAGDGAAVVKSHINDWLLGEGWRRLQQAIETLAKRHQIGRSPVAVSLSGDFCVTRISTGSNDDVDHELQSLASRIPRYLQLGPGGKLTGQIRESLSSGVQYALTAVGNHTRLTALYEAFNASDVEVLWIEPSLVSMARLVGVLGLDRDQPILIADSFGQSWEVGITHQGRLLLDYRPAAALDAKSFATAIDEHLTRLRRFCLRHRGMTETDLNEIYLGGPREKVDPVLDHFKQGHELKAQTYRIPSSIIAYHAGAQTEHDVIAGVAALFPLVGPENSLSAPDLLQSIRRQRGRSRWSTALRTWWPVAAAATILIALSSWTDSIESQSEQKLAEKTFVETQMRATRVRMAALQSDRQSVEYLSSIEAKTVPAPIADLIELISQCLPPQSFLKSVRLESDRNIQLVGVTPNEAEVYEIVGYLRRLPGMDQVALLGTSSGAKEGEAQFELRLSWNDPDTRLPSPTTLNDASSARVNL